MNLQKEIKKLLQEIGPGRMMNTVYDTAWVARLTELDEPLGEQALEWLREQQLPDGSWGAEAPCYYHDRVICTLAAMNALARYGNARDVTRIRRAEAVLPALTKRLNADSAGATVGFEMIVPTLVKEAKEIKNAGVENGNVLLEQLGPYRSAKLAALPGKMINRNVTVAHSLEMAGPDGMHLIDFENLQEANGSIGHSPSATAYFALWVNKGDEGALKYLRHIAPDGYAPNVAPFDIFEPAWVLWNLTLQNLLDDEMVSFVEPHLSFLKAAWMPGRGVGHAADFTPKDSDDTSLVYELLTRCGKSVDLGAVLHYEGERYFRCFAYESNPSISANIHVLGALRHAGLKATHPSVEKVLRFLKQARTGATFWHDKWHVSPYYATSHAIIALLGYVDSLAEPAIRWLCETQNPDGSWGYYLPTAEETAYALQALAIGAGWGQSVPKSVLEKGRIWLADHATLPYVPLWIGKCLYCPELVVQSTILSALVLTRGS